MLAGVAELSGHEVRGAQARAREAAETLPGCMVYAFALVYAIFPGPRPNAASGQRPTRPTMRESRREPMLPAAFLRPARTPFKPKGRSQASKLARDSPAPATLSRMKTMNHDLAALHRSVRRLQAALAALVLAFGMAALAAFRPTHDEQDVIRTRGIVIVDASGRERILLGAPIPDAGNRVRTDIRRVERLWGARFPRRYITEWYPTYRNSVNGMIVLDENGIDRLAIGDSVPDPNIGRRVGSEVGIIINDAEGFERSGYGLLRVDSAYRVSLGLDQGGREAISLVVDDASGNRGIIIGGDSSRLFLGHAPHGAAWRVPASFSGLHLTRGAASRAVTAGQP